MGFFLLMEMVFLTFQRVGEVPEKGLYFLTTIFHGSGLVHQLGMDLDEVGMIVEPRLCCGKTHHVKALGLLFGVEMVNQVELVPEKSPFLMSAWVHDLGLVHGMGMVVELGVFHG